MARINKYPEEFYGQLVTPATLAQIPPLLASQHCPFLNTKCKKTRKSDKSQTIGSCIVGFQGNHLVVCPYRFIQDNVIFEDARYLLSPGMELRIVPEITMPGGLIDYFLVSFDGNEVRDYLGLEIQTLDTTGSGGIWQARQDLTAGQLQASYSYGINWKMSAKTILVQLFHKAAAFDTLSKKFVLTIQTEFFMYLQDQFQAQHLRPANSDDMFHLHVYDCIQQTSGLRLQLNSRLSTDLAGVEQMLSQGAAKKIVESDVVQRIRAKLDKSRLLSETQPLDVSSVSEDGVEVEE